MRAPSSCVVNARNINGHKTPINDMIKRTDSALETASDELPLSLETAYFKNKSKLQLIFVFVYQYKN